MSPEAIAFVQSSLFDYFIREYVSGVAEEGVTCEYNFSLSSLQTLILLLPVLKNASIHLVTILFSIVYPTSTPDFFTTFISLLRQNSSAPSTSTSPPLNAKTTDLFLRILHEISTEISDSTLRLNKTPARSTRDGLLRDAVRLRDAEKVSVLLWQILEESLNGLGQVDNGIGLKGKNARETTEMVVRVIGDYVCECSS